MTELASMGGDTAADNEDVEHRTDASHRCPTASTSVDGPLDHDELASARRLVAGGELPGRRSDLPDGQPAAARAAASPSTSSPACSGHFGTVPGLNLVYVHANRLILARDLDAVFVAGPGHGGPGPNACAWLEGTYSELYSHIPAGRARAWRRFFASSPSPAACRATARRRRPARSTRAASSATRCCTPTARRSTTPISRSSAWSATARPRPARWPPAGTATSSSTRPATAPCCRSSRSTSTRSPIRRCWPASREDELLDLMRGYGYDPHLVAGNDPGRVHQADGRDDGRPASTASREIQAPGPRRRRPARPAWPMIVLRTPKGWTCPPVVDGQQVEGTFRAHQVPLPAARTDDEHRAVLEAWLRSYRPEELFDDDGRPVPELLALSPNGQPRMSAQPGRQRRRPAARPAAARLARLRRRRRSSPGLPSTRRPACSGAWLRDVTSQPDNFLTFAPDELASNRLQDILEVTGRAGRPRSASTTSSSTAPGRVIEVLSEHICQGLLEGYLLTGRHGVFTCYEAFIHIVDSMFNQHAKWLEASAQVPWRRPLASLNYLLSSHVWRQDHNGFTHQDPGFLDVVMNKKPEIVRVYLPPDANTLLSTYDHCLRSRHYVNVVVAGKQPQADWLSVEDAALHCARGARDLGLGRHRRRHRRRCPTSCWPAPERSRPWRRWPPRRSCASGCPTCGSGSSTSST